MALKSGTIVGPYEVVAPLGAGGMGEVTLVPAGEPIPNSITVVLNWAEELE